jgi:hypothetical protein
VVKMCQCCLCVWCLPILRMQHLQVVNYNHDTRSRLLRCNFAFRDRWSYCWPSKNFVCRDWSIKWTLCLHSHRPLPVDLIFHAVVRLSDGGGRKRVGLADVGAGLEVLPVDVVDGLGPGVRGSYMIYKTYFCRKICDH